MKNKLSPKVSIEIKPSRVALGGVGIFAVYDFKKNDIIGRPDSRYPSVFLTWNEVSKLDGAVQRMVTKFCIGSAEGVWSPLNFDFLPAIWFINHCCDYNIGFDTKDNFIAIKNIKAGEELCIDYGLAISNPDFKMECTCGSVNCRKIITGNDWHVFIAKKSTRDLMFTRLRKFYSSQRY